MQAGHDAAVRSPPTRPYDPFVTNASTDNVRPGISAVKPAGQPDQCASEPVVSGLDAHQAGPARAPAELAWAPAGPDCRANVFGRGTSVGWAGCRDIFDILDHFPISFFAIKLPFRSGIGNPIWFTNTGELGRDSPGQARYRPGSPAGAFAGMTKGCAVGRPGSTISLTNLGSLSSSAIRRRRPAGSQRIP